MVPGELLGFRVKFVVLYMLSGVLKLEGSGFGEIMIYGFGVSV